MVGAGVASDSATARTAGGRATVLTMTQAAEDAVLRPHAYGAFPHALRAALAGRVALLGGDEVLAAHYLAAAGDKAPLADPDQSGTDQDLAEVLRFVDKVANQTRDVVADDIAGLQSAGVADADIVRLCELVAFLAYQLRVIAGLRMMEGTSA